MWYTLVLVMNIKNLIGKNFKYGLMDGDLHLTNFDNQQLGLTNIIKKYLEEKNINVDDRLINFKKSIENFANTIYFGSA